MTNLLMVVRGDLTHFLMFSKFNVLLIVRNESDRRFKVIFSPPCLASQFMVLTV